MRELLVFIVFIIFPVCLVAQSQECPCCSERHTDFNFWLGEWKVTNANGTLAGNNTITKVQNGCVVKEEWTSATAGYTGTSYNFYNKNTEQWEQIWIDSQGSSLHLCGQKIANRMVLQSEEFKNAKGQLLYHRVTWTEQEDGTVRQLWQTLDQKGGAITVFDGIYTKE